MPQEIQLPEHHRASLLLHRRTAKRDDQLLQWLEELVQHKLKEVDARKASIEALQTSIKDLVEEVERLKTYKSNVVLNTKANLETILKEAVTEIGLGPNARAQLLFEGDEPKIFLHE